MGRPISLFSGYSQGENRTTNYCLLILKMLYEENPKFLDEALNIIVGENSGLHIGVAFSQQERKAETVPDGLIKQSAFTIYIETKNFNWMYDSQLEGHLAALEEEASGFKVLIALANYEVNPKQQFERITKLCAEKYNRTIIFKDVSFEVFADALPNPDRVPKNLADMVTEFKTYLDEQGLLPAWKGQLDVVGCGVLPDDILRHHVYMCPATAGSYWHSRCKFFGMYRGKCVEKVALIRAVVDVEDGAKASLRWSNVEAVPAELEALAREKVAVARPGEYPTRVFLLDRLYDTNFRKDSPGGMLGKRYFDVGPLNVTDAEGLARALDGKPWSWLAAQAVR